MRQNRSSEAKAATRRKLRSYTRNSRYNLRLLAPILSQNILVDASVSAQSLTNWSCGHNSCGLLKVGWRYGNFERQVLRMETQDGRQPWWDYVSAVFDYEKWKISAASNKEFLERRALLRNIKIMWASARRVSVQNLYWARKKDLELISRSMTRAGRRTEPSKRKPFSRII